MCVLFVFLFWLGLVQILSFFFLRKKKKENGILTQITSSQWKLHVGTTVLLSWQEQVVTFVLAFLFELSLDNLKKFVTFLK